MRREGKSDLTNELACRSANSSVMPHIEIANLAYKNNEIMRFSGCIPGVIFPLDPVAITPVQVDGVGRVKNRTMPAKINY